MLSKDLDVLIGKCLKKLLICLTHESLESCLDFKRGIITIIFIIVLKDYLIPNTSVCLYIVALKKTLKTNSVKKFQGVVVSCNNANILQSKVLTF